MREGPETEYAGGASVVVGNCCSFSYGFPIAVCSKGARDVGDTGEWKDVFEELDLIEAVLFLRPRPFKDPRRERLRDGASSWVGRGLFEGMINDDRGDTGVWM